MGMTITAVLLLLVTLGVPLALIVGAACGVIARLRGLVIWKFAGMGALYGAFVFPWPYLLIRMFNRSPPLPILGVIYFFPYVIWLGVVLLMGSSVLFIWQYTTGTTSTGYVAPKADVVSAVFMSVLIIGVAALCVFTLLLSIRGLYRRHKVDRTYLSMHDLPHSAYLMPFFFVYSWLIAGLIMAFVLAHYMISIGVDIQGF